ncbi:hypothetical protein [Halocatena pleomorpha]|uniref:Uncharacterized protein n=1 Tax=Halocatena pleomorpha TaxID=1785090 RepID=A0A3P3R928_9EURY|nr:hypothetical protein [Halocatena pleomorpha]RRJ29548.1 hypothetical protein EIK79_13000 [Halocatena pleomorpha]
MSVTRKIASAVGSIIGQKIGDVFGQKLEAVISSQSMDESDMKDEEPSHRTTAIGYLRNALTSTSVNEVERKDESGVSEDEEAIDTKSESDDEKSQGDPSEYLDDISDAELWSLTNQLLDELDRRQSK